MEANRFAELAAINVGPHIEKKGGLSYLSWPWAIDQLLRRDPDASWVYGEPVKYGETMMVVCTVTAFGKPRTMQLPVMDNRNKPIPNPDAFAVNTAMQRCLVKAIALHGLGLYIYAGEDLPLGDAESATGAGASTTSGHLDPDTVINLEADMKKAKSRAALRKILETAHATARDANDAYAFKRFTETASALAEFLPVVEQPRAKTAESASAEPKAADEPTQEPPADDKSEPRASPGLVKMIQAQIDAKKIGDEFVAKVTGGVPLASLSKSRAAAIHGQFKALT